MLLTPKIRQAIKLSATQHQSQKRHDSITPFIVHPVEVAFLVAGCTPDEDTICAALLHDVLEDTQGCSADDLKSIFGQTVADYVQLLSEPPSPSLSWVEKHQLFLDTLQASPPQVILISLADKYANLSQGNPRPDRKWYYQRLIEIYQSCPQAASTPLFAEFRMIVDKVS